jgi:hypothetical protein
VHLPLERVDGSGVSNARLARFSRPPYVPTNARTKKNRPAGRFSEAMLITSKQPEQRQPKRLQQQPKQPKQQPKQPKRQRQQRPEQPG